jgi:S-adenosylmethionine synthetase
MLIPKNYTAESVTSGHPDKVCDQISDAILDHCLEQDPDSRVAAEVFGSHDLLVIGGEITTRAKIDYQKIARETYQGIGYQDNLKIIVNVLEQSPDISLGVDVGGAGDQGIMYGFATNETPEFMPQGIMLAHKLAQQLEKTRRKHPFLRPDGKTQVTVLDKKVSTVLVSVQHTEEISQEELRDLIIKETINPIINQDFEILVNPTGKFIVGGFTADTGLTGRKIMVDTYGGIIPHGGGCFSGKDATKVDRSAAYMCRFVAKNIVANGYAEKCLVSVAYAIGRAEPLMVEAVNEKNESLASLVEKNFDFKPRAIIERLNLKSPIYRKTSAYGHFGKQGLPWEEIVSL